MKKIGIKAAVVMALMIVFVLAGCGGQKASSEDVEFLTAAEPWYHYDEVTGENEVMHFSEDFSFYWGCECGEPVGYSDLLELYDYDTETGIIKLYNNFDNTSMEIKVHDYSDYHLLLEIEGEIKDYTYIDTCIEDGLDLDQLEEYMTDYSGEFTITEGNAENVTLTHFNYDGDVDYPDNAFKTYEITKDAEFYYLDVFTHFKDGEMVEHNVDHGELTREDLDLWMESGSAVVWFDKDLKISKMMFYGATRFEE